MIIAEYCNYAAHYAGNFIRSLQSMEHFVKEKNPQSQVIYIFPEYTKDLLWAQKLSQTNTVLYLPEKGRLKTNLNLINICKQYNVDIFHSHFYGLTSIFLISYFTKTKVIAHFHNTIDDISFKKRLLYKCLGLSVCKFIGCAKSVYDTLIKSGFNKSKTSYITNCIDFSRLDGSRFGEHKPCAQSNLLILGTDFYRKGVDTALKAIDPIAKEFNICLQIVSHHPKITKDEVIKECGILPDWASVIPTTEFIGDYYRNAKLFLSPSRNEGLSYAIPEAIYCNCLPIKSNLPSLTYNLYSEETISTDGTVEDLRNKIIRFLEMSENDKFQFLSILKQQVTNMYSVEKWGEEMYYLYKNLS